MKRGLIAAAYVGGFVLSALLAGCGTTMAAGPATTAVSSPPTSPISSDDASSAYSAFLTTFEAVTERGGENPDILNSVASGSALKLAKESANDFKSRSYHSAGHVEVISAQLQASTSDSASIYVCEDHTKFDVLDDAGQSIASADRQTKFAYVASFVVSAGSLKLDSLIPWTGGTVCT